MFQNNDRFSLIQTTQNHFRLYAIFSSVTRLLRIFSSHQIKSIIDQHHFVIQNPDLCFFCKFFKSWITHLFSLRRHRKSTK